jgi:hypothetical protein
VKHRIYLLRFDLVAEHRPATDTFLKNPPLEYAILPQPLE